jgi:hypothetical protein
MKRSVTATLFAAILTLTGAVAANAAPIVIDFESYTAGDVLAANTDLGGIYFNHAIEIYNSSPFPPFSTGNGGINADDFAGDFSGGFITEVNSFSLAVGDNCCDPDDAVLSVFDADMNLLGTASFFDQTSGQILSVIASGIKYFSVDQESLVVFDNLTFEVGEVEAVPEPASLLMLGAGLGVVAVRLRSARRK